MKTVQYIGIAQNLREALAMLLIFNPAATGTMNIKHEGARWLFLLEKGVIRVIGSSLWSDETAMQVLSNLLNLKNGQFEFVEYSYADNKPLDSEPMQILAANLLMTQIIDRKFAAPL